jgi:predicted AlkP superfamily pyrophosphatase or phosphodiesterase
MRTKIFLVVVFLHLIVVTVSAQNSDRPKLVVGIIIDQMRFEYLYRFNSFYGKGGFNRLMNDGTNFSFAHYNYVPTSTAPGHASVYTGTTPFYHGIIGNDWYDKTTKKMVNCVSDSKEKNIGSDDKKGGRSPKRLLSTTITDQLKMATNNTSKVISISLKDRGAVLPGGHLANAAYWFNPTNGDFISSSYYMKSLPGWVEDFNKRRLMDKYLLEGWNLSLPISDYNISLPDETDHEKDLFNEGETSFPHLFNRLPPETKYDAMENTPFGDQIIGELVVAAMKNENLGQDKETDFLAISFSSPDHIGHEYGTYSFEIQDAYIKLDALIEYLLNSFDEQVGKGNYLLFLTADHGAMETPAYLNDLNLPYGELNSKKFLDSLKAFANYKFGNEKLIENSSNKQLFFNRDLIKKRNLDIHNVEQLFSDYIRDTFPAIASIYKRDDLEGKNALRESSNLTLNGFNPSRSGDLAYTLQPGFLQNFQNQGTGHSSGYSYDTHVPLLFYGWHIPKQVVNTPVYIVDIAATLADLLNITEPSASMGVPIIK